MIDIEQLQASLGKIGIEKHAELVKEVLKTADNLLLSCQETTLDKGEEIGQAFFFVNQKGLTLFEPNACIIDAPRDMSVDDSKDMIAKAIRDIAGEVSAIAAIHISEGYSLAIKKEGYSKEEMDRVYQYGSLKDHPNSIEILLCTVNFNFRGQGHGFVCTYKIEQSGDKRVMVELHPWSAEFSKAEGRFCIEAMYLMPLT